MKKTFVIALAALSTAFATPAMASNADNFDGARVGVFGGVTGDEFAIEDSSDFTYGAVAGYDFAITDNFLLGVEAEVAVVDVAVSPLVESNRQISAAVRATVPLSSKVAIFGSVGYTNLGVDIAGLDADFDGYRVGGGAEFKVSENFYVNTEYRYSDFDVADGFNGGAHSALVGVGLRF